MVSLEYCQHCLEICDKTDVHRESPSNMTELQFFLQKKKKGRYVSPPNGEKIVKHVCSYNLGKIWFLKLMTVLINICYINKYNMHPSPSTSD